MMPAAAVPTSVVMQVFDAWGACADRPQEYCRRLLAPDGRAALDVFRRSRELVFKWLSHIVVAEKFLHVEEMSIAVLLTVPRFAKGAFSTDVVTTVSSFLFGDVDDSPLPILAQPPTLCRVRLDTLRHRPLPNPLCGEEDVVAFARREDTLLRQLRIHYVHIACRYARVSDVVNLLITRYGLPLGSLTKHRRSAAHMIIVE